MKRPSLALLVLFIAGISVCGQSLARNNSNSETVTERSSNRASATQAISALKRLNVDVLTYRSLVEFEADGRLARVSIQKFESDLRDAALEMEPLMSQIPDGNLKIALANALESYRDGLYWWGQLDEPRVISISALAASNRTGTAADNAFLSTIPYTVAIHWRQAARYLTRAEQLINSR